MRATMWHNIYQISWAIEVNKTSRMPCSMIFLRAKKAVIYSAPQLEGRQLQTRTNLVAELYPPLLSG